MMEKLNFKPTGKFYKVFQGFRRNFDKRSNTIIRSLLTTFDANLFNSRSSRNWVESIFNPLFKLSLPNSSNCTLERHIVEQIFCSFQIKFNISLYFSPFQIYRRDVQILDDTDAAFFNQVSAKFLLWFRQMLGKI